MPVFDYKTPGAYFVTICAHARQLLFEDPEVQGVIVRCWKAIPEHMPNVSIDSFVVMPNHVHGIVNIEENRRAVGALNSAHLRPEAPSLLTVIQTFKGAVTRALRQNGIVSLDTKIWQRSFYDRVIRDDAELDRIRAYIANNPAAWAYDHDNPDCRPNATYVAEWGWLEAAPA